MKISIFQKIVLLSTIILTGNGIIGYTVYKSGQKLRNSAQWVQHTEQVISHTNLILSTGKDIESASQGFVITNDSDYLTPLFTAQKTIFEYISHLRQLIVDNPSQLQRIDSLNFYITKRLDFSLSLVERRSKQGSEAAIALPATKAGKLYSFKIRQFIEAIQLEENILLTQRKQANEHIADTYNKVTVAMFISMALFTILLVIATGKNLMKNKEKEKRAAALRIADQEIIIQNEEKVKQLAANKELEAFSYSVSHDLRAPLRHIAGFVDLLLKNNASQLDAGGLRYLNIIADSAHEMGDLIDALLSFSRLSRTELTRTKIDMKNIVNHLFMSFSDELAGRDIAINIGELPEALGDETLIKMVWTNLMSNAFKYSRNKVKVIINIEGKIGNGQTVYSIKDNGAGFDMKYADKLFCVFQRLHKARDFEGIGIGLANVNRIIARHGGSCWAEGEIDKGATFYFSMPTK